MCFVELLYLQFSKIPEGQETEMVLQYLFSVQRLSVIPLGQSLDNKAVSQ